MLNPELATLIAAGAAIHDIARPVPTSFDAAPTFSRLDARGWTRRRTPWPPRRARM